MKAAMQELLDINGEVIDLADHGVLTRYQKAEDQSSLDFMVSDLARSGLTPDDMPCYPISQNHFGAPAYAIPYPNNHDMWDIRIDRPSNKYIGPRECSDIYRPSGIRKDMLQRASDIWIIEGVKKAVKFLTANPNKLVIGFRGAWNLQKDGRLLPSLIEVLHPGVRVHTIFDGDIDTNPRVQQAASDLHRLLSQIHVALVLYHPKDGYKGIDDQLTQEPSSSTELVHVRAEDLVDSKTRLCKSLGCAYNNDDKLVLNDLNAKKLLANYFKSQLANDRRLGLLYQGLPINIEDLESISVEYLQGAINYNFRMSQIKAGLNLAKADIPETDCIRDLVKSVRWDGKHRLDTWAETYLPCSFQKHANEAGRVFMTGLGLRILQPGTQVDTVFNLVGRQGLGKTTFFESLATFEGRTYYKALTTVPEVDGDGNRTVADLYTKCLIVDLAEGVLVAKSHRNQGNTKQFLTDKEDSYRVAYARVPTTVRRGFVFVGTTNSNPGLGDHTGSRRFDNLEPLSITQIPYFEKLQLLAEVAHFESQIRASSWYELRISREDLPAELLEGNEHIEDVHEIINQQHSGADPFGELLLQNLCKGQVAMITALEIPFVTSQFLAHMTQNTDSLRTMRYGAAMLDKLKASPSFPYIITKLRKTPSVLTIPAHLSHCYIPAPSSGQMHGWAFTLRESIPLAPRASHQEPGPSAESTDEVSA